MNVCRWRRLALPALVLLLALGQISPAQALLIRSFSLADLGREAHAVVLGQVVGARSFYSDDRSVIYTHYTLEVQAIYKGLTPSIIEVRLIGGHVDDRELTVTGNPVLETGETVLLFLRDYDAFYTMVGMNQGKWSVRELLGRLFAFRGQAPTLPGPVEGEAPLELLLKECGLDMAEVQP